MDQKTVAKVAKLGQLVDTKYTGTEKELVKRHVAEFFDDFVKISSLELTKLNQQDVCVAIAEYIVKYKYTGAEKTQVATFLSLNYTAAKDAVELAEREYLEQMRREKSAEELKKRCTAVLKNGARCRNMGKAAGRCKRHTDVPAAPAQPTGPQALAAAVKA